MVWKSGAEAVLRRGTLLGKKIVVKERIQKRYRNESLDKKLRVERTREEARLLSMAKEGGVRCPFVYAVSEYAITMSYVKGEMLHELIEKRKPDNSVLEACGKMLAALHSRNIIHGDFTPANIMVCKDGITLIDFGLGFFSLDDEDKAVDILTMKKALGNSASPFLSAYGNPSMLKRVEGIEKRARYQERA